MGTVGSVARRVALRLLLLCFAGAAFAQGDEAANYECSYSYREVGELGIVLAGYDAALKLTLLPGGAGRGRGSMTTFAGINTFSGDVVWVTAAAPKGSELIVRTSLPPLDISVEIARGELRRNGDFRHESSGETATGSRWTRSSVCEHTGGTLPGKLLR